MVNKLTKEDKEHIAYQKVIPYKIGDMEKKTNFSYWKHWYKYRKLKRKLFLVIMQLRSGQLDSFTVSTNAKYFERKGGVYQIDPDMGKPDALTRLNVYFYHQDIAAPFRLDFNIDELHKKLDATDNSIKKALNPSSLKEFFNSQVIEKILKGQELSDQMKMLKMLVLITLLIAGVNLIINLKSTGVL